MCVCVRAHCKASIFSLFKAYFIISIIHTYMCIPIRFLTRSKVSHDNEKVFFFQLFCIFFRLNFTFSLWFSFLLTFCACVHHIFFCYFFTVFCFGLLLLLVFHIFCVVCECAIFDKGIPSDHSSVYQWHSTPFKWIYVTRKCWVLILSNGFGFFSFCFCTLYFHSALSQFVSLFRVL